MKSILFLISLASTALAQHAFIGLPKEDAQIPRGSDLLVQIRRPDSLMGAWELAIAIGLASCGSSPCYPAHEIMGDILHTGPFHPQFHQPGLPPYENFTVRVPHYTPKGHAQLNVAHASLNGGGPSPVMEIMNHTVFVV